MLFGGESTTGRHRRDLWRSCMGRMIQTTRRAWTPKTTTVLASSRHLPRTLPRSPPEGLRSDDTVTMQSVIDPGRDLPYGLASQIHHRDLQAVGDLMMMPISSS